MAPAPEPTLIKPEYAACAVDALLAWTRARSDHQKPQLFEADDLLHLLLTLRRIPPNGRTNPYRISLPHPLHPFDPQSTSICLLADDSQTESVQSRIRGESLPITTVIGLSDLRSDYRPYESRRKLADSYDLFFADRKVLPLLPRLLGNHFFKKKKIPLAVDLLRPGWPQQVRAACGSTLLYLRTGTCCALKVGRVTMGSEEIVENVMAAIEGAVGLVPRSWGNVRSVHLKLAESPALPIYEVVPEIGLKIEGGGKLVDEGEVLDPEEELVAEARSLERKGRKKGRIHHVQVFDGDDVSVEEEGPKKRKKHSKVDGAEKSCDDEVDDGGDLIVKKKTKKKKDGDKNINADDCPDGVNKKKEKKSKPEGQRSGNDSEDLSANAEKKKSKPMIQEGERSGDLSAKMKVTKRMDAVDSADRVNNKKSKAGKLEKKKEVKKGRSEV